MRRRSMHAFFFTHKNIFAWPQEWPRCRDRGGTQASGLLANPLGSHINHITVGVAEVSRASNGKIFKSDQMGALLNGYNNGEMMHYSNIGPSSVLSRCLFVTLMQPQPCFQSPWKLCERPSLFVGLKMKCECFFLKLLFCFKSKKRKCFA